MFAFLKKKTLKELTKSLVLAVSFHLIVDTPFFLFCLCFILFFYTKNVMKSAAWRSILSKRKELDQIINKLTKTMYEENKIFLLDHQIKFR